MALLIFAARDTFLHFFPLLREVLSDDGSKRKHCSTHAMQKTCPFACVALKKHIIHAAVHAWVTTGHLAAPLTVSREDRFQSMKDGAASASWQ